MYEFSAETEGITAEAKEKTYRLASTYWSCTVYAVFPALFFRHTLSIFISFSFPPVSLRLSFFRSPFTFWFYILGAFKNLLETMYSAFASLTCLPLQFDCSHSPTHSLPSLIYSLFLPSIHTSFFFLFLPLLFFPTFHCPFCRKKKSIKTFSGSLKQSRQKFIMDGWM